MEGKALTKSEERQVQLLRRLEEDRRAKAEAKAMEERKQAALRARLKASTAGISSRLLAPKRVNDERLEEEKEGKEELREEKEKVIKMVRRLQSKGPDPRHAAFLEKLAEQKRLREQEEREKSEKERRKKEAVAQAARSRLRRDATQREDEVDEQRNQEVSNDEAKEEKSEEEGKRSVRIPKVWKKHVEAVESDKHAKFDQERSLDRARWAQRHGIEEDTPVFVCSSRYPAVREELVRRGWYENKDLDSPIWDFYYATKVSPFMSRSLRDDQIVNRFFGTSKICSKAGISKSLKSVKWFDEADADSFFPRCYHLGRTSDGNEYDDFVEDFCVTSAERLLKVLESKLSCSQCGANTLACQGCESKHANRIEGAPFVLQTAMRVCNKFMNRFNDDYVDSPSTFVPPVVTVLEWTLIKDLVDAFVVAPTFASRFRHFAQSGSVDQLYELFSSSVDKDTYFDLQIPVSEGLDASEIESRKKDVKRYVMHQIKKMMTADKEGKLDVQVLECDMLEKAMSVLSSLKEFRSSQGKLNGGANGKNVWIVKPGGKSRGRGIQCFNDLGKILKYTRANSQETTDWVVQKYMENSLIVHKRKFDIRQWVLVTNWNPLTIYFFDNCYLRFCVEEYSLDNLEDRFIHLANNSISKHSEKFNSGPIEGNMWKRDSFIQYMDELGVPGGGKAKWENEIKPGLQDIVRLSMSCVQDLVQHRSSSFEIFGFDFMLDETFKPWLIEINSSPSMEYSTEVTKELASEALRSAVAVVLDAKYQTLSSGKRKLRLKPSTEKVDTGMWELLFASPHEHRRKLDTIDLSVSGSGIDKYNKGAERRNLRAKTKSSHIKTKHAKEENEVEHDGNNSSDE